MQPRSLWPKPPAAARLSAIFHAGSFSGSRSKQPGCAQRRGCFIQRHWTHYGRRFEIRRLFLIRGEILDAAHLGEGEQECEGRFGALVLVDPVDMQTVSATTALSVVEREAKVVSAMKPLERLVRLQQPVSIARGLVSFNAGANSCVRIDWLLVE